MSDERQQGSGVVALVVTHGDLARELVGAAKKIVGETSRLRAICIRWDQDVSSARESIEKAISGMSDADGVLIFTDMFGGTPTNISLSFLDPGRIEIVTGVNLPMLVKFLSLEIGDDLETAVQQVSAKGQQSIHSASEILGRRTKGSPRG